MKPGQQGSPVTNKGNGRKEEISHSYVLYPKFNSRTLLLTASRLGCHCFLPVLLPSAPCPTLRSKGNDLSFSTCNVHAHSLFSACPIPSQSTHLPASYFHASYPTHRASTSSTSSCAHVLCSHASSSNIPLKKIPQLVSLLPNILDFGNRDTTLSFHLCIHQVTVPDTK